MTQTQRTRKRVPGPQGPVVPQGTANPLADNLSLAFFAASQDGCNCRACQLLRKALSAMIDQKLQEG